MLRLIRRVTSLFRRSRPSVASVDVAAVLAEMDRQIAERRAELTELERYRAGHWIDPDMAAQLYDKSPAWRTGFVASLHGPRANPVDHYGPSDPITSLEPPSETFTIWLPPEESRQ